LKTSNQQNKQNVVALATLVYAILPAKKKQTSVKVNAEINK